MISFPQRTLTYPSVYYFRMVRWWWRLLLPLVLLSLDSPVYSHASVDVFTRASFLSPTCGPDIVGWIFWFIHHTHGPHEKVNKIWHFDKLNIVFNDFFLIYYCRWSWRHHIICPPTTFNSIQHVVVDFPNVSVPSIIHLYLCCIVKEAKRE